MVSMDLVVFLYYHPYSTHALSESKANVETIFQAAQESTGKTMRFRTIISHMNFLALNKCGMFKLTIYP